MSGINTNQGRSNINSPREARKAVGRKKVNQVWSKQQFRQFIQARFPASAEYHLASLTAIPASTCRKHINGETKPCADHALQYLAIFGPELASVVMGNHLPAWLERSRHVEEKRDLEFQRRQIDERLAEYSAGT